MGNKPTLLVSPEQLNVGDVLLRRKLMVMHVGIYLGDNMVLHSRPSTGEEKTSLAIFSNSKDTYFVSSNISADKVLANAELILSDQKDYHLFKQNCEHTAHKALELPEFSRQLDEIEAWGIIGAAFGYSWGRKGMVIGGLLGVAAGLVSLPQMRWLNQKL